jgi:hypothetical protein
VPQESIPDDDSHTPGIPLGAAQTSPNSPAQPSSLVAENTSGPSAATTLQDAAQTARPQPTSSSSYQAILISKPVPEVPREHIAEAGVPADVPPRVTVQATTPGFTQRGDRTRVNTPPRNTVRVTRRPYSTRGDAAHAPLPFVVPPDELYRRSNGHYVDSETLWQLDDDREPVRPITCLLSRPALA